MSDRVRTQQRLADDLASLVFVVPKAQAIPFLRAFFMIMCREWSKIDVLRLNKFLLLLRRYIAAGFRLLHASKWDESLINDYNEVLSQHPLQYTFLLCQS